MRPDHGVRIALTLREAAGARASYELAVFTKRAEATALATVTAGSAEAEVEVEIGGFQGAEPAVWIRAFAKTLLRTLSRVKSSGADWPRRVTRWRPEPEAQR